MKETFFTFTILFNIFFTFQIHAKDLLKSSEKFSSETVIKIDTEKTSHYFYGYDGGHINAGFYRSTSKDMVIPISIKKSTYTSDTFKYYFYGNDDDPTLLDPTELFELRDSFKCRFNTGFKALPYYMMSSLDFSHQVNIGASYDKAYATIHIKNKNEEELGSLEEHPYIHITCKDSRDRLPTNTISFKVPKEPLKITKVYKSVVSSYSYRRNNEYIVIRTLKVDVYGTCDSSAVTNVDIYLAQVYSGDSHHRVKCKNNRFSKENINVIHSSEQHSALKVGAYLPYFNSFKFFNIRQRIYTPSTHIFGHEY